jgi:hypothetical protein
MYECHVTFNKEREEDLKDLAKEFHWKYSAIDGDPVLGNKVFAYLTTHDKDYDTIYRRMKTVEELACLQGTLPVRSKIEHIVYDTKVKLNVE